MSRRISRRGLLTAGSAAGASLLLSGCDGVLESPSMRGALDFGQLVSLRVQRLLLSGQPLAREFAVADISPEFPLNGTSMPSSFAYFQMMVSQFASWRLTVDGMVRRPLSLSLAEIKALPARTQITQHNCDEGWTAIGQWTGVALSHLLQASELMPDVRYIVFHCLDELERTPDRSGLYYESLDLFDAFHPQTILAYGMNGQALPVGHGAPLRLRVERQIGYKNAKYVTRIEAVDRLDRVGRGKGGFWEDRGYQWYAGL
jgi:DMSO/TMAO reductase YedYZ molybdopterin-dependent catalytic subunit